MRKRNRLLAVGIVGVAVLAACFGNLAINYSETEQKTMTYPSSASAGNVMVGQSGMTGPILFSPATEIDNDTITSITENCTNWGLNLDPLPANVYCILVGQTGGSEYGSGSCIPVTYSFDATFTPTSAGPSSCPVTLAYTSNAGPGSGVGTLLVVLNGTGVAPTYSFITDPPNGSTLQYSDIPINTTSTSQEITVSNNGTGTITVMGTNSDPARFPVTPVGTANFASQTLGTGQIARFEVACNPLAMTMYAGTLVFTANTPSGEIQRSISLRCNGITSDLAITPSPAGFARGTLVGVPPANLTINIVNNGASTTFTNVSLETGGEVSIIQGPASPLPNGGQTTIVLGYTAATERPFGKIDSLILTQSQGAPRTITINAEALVGEIGVTPAVVDFGPVCPGGEKTADLMVYATSSGPVNLTSITQPNAPFSVSGTGGQLQPNHGNIISLTARVQATAAGELDDAFVLNTNLPGAAAMHAVQLRGVALPAGITPTPDVVHFGPGRVGTPTTAKKVTVSNCGTTDLVITGVRLEGESAREFAIVSPENPLQTISMMGELEFLVIMDPETPGTKVAKLVIEHADGRIEADLDGNGFGGTDEGEEKSTYYTCSAGSVGLGGLPIVLALLLRRRRRANA
ncbi:MAG: choice-of-anchor D domain-containing protein [Kofleriaceae bacterium]